jgi:hypothetical protein
VRDVVDRLEALDPDWVHAMHGGTITRDAFPRYVSALRTEPFAFQGTLLGRPIGESAGPLPMAVEADPGGQAGREAAD